jgi:monovalent cation/hydrogen antiporter
MIGWAGTRGLVTVATALALPQSFPERGMLLFAAFTVTLGTLVIQGLTLRPLVLALGVRDGATVEREVRQARIATAEAALAALVDETGGEAEALRAEFQIERRIGAAGDEGDVRPTSPSKALRAKAVAAQRHRLLAIRSDGVIGDEAFHRLEEELDFSDLAVTRRS